MQIGKGNKKCDNNSHLPCKIQFDCGEKKIDNKN
jgi:hypothetical protein